MKKRSIVTGIVFSFLAIVGFCALFAVPFIMSFVYSFSRTSGTFQFVGLQNYILLFESSSFRLACINTIRFFATGLIILMVFSILMAVMMTNLFRYRVKYRSFWFALNLCPMVIPSSAIILFIQIMLERYGVVNGLLVSWGMEPIDFLHGPASFWVLVVLYIWKNYSYIMVVLFAGMRQIDNEIYEASALDGAGKGKTFFYITLPNIVPFLVFGTIMGIMGIFKSFRESFLMFGEYPHEAAYMLQNFMNNNYYSLNYQRLSSASVIFFLAISIILIAMLKINAKEREL